MHIRLCDFKNTPHTKSNFAPPGGIYFSKIKLRVNPRYKNESANDTYRQQNTQKANYKKHVATQQLCDILHKIGNAVALPKQPKEKNMFDMFKEFDKKWQDLAKQVKQVNDFWIDSIISSLKQFQK